MTTRIGKIGRLPKSIREELGRRIEDGLPGNEIVQWLNTQPDAMAVLAKYFEGRPVTEQNLSDWKQSGHLDWVRLQEARWWAGRLTEEAEGVDEMTEDNHLTDVLAMTLAVQIGQAGSQLVEQSADVKERWERLCKVNREVSILGRDADRRERTNNQWQRWQWQMNRQDDLDEKQQEMDHRKERLERYYDRMELKERSELIGARAAQRIFRIKHGLSEADLNDGTWEGKEAARQEKIRQWKLEQKGKAQKSRAKGQSRKEGKRKHSTLNIQHSTSKEREGQRANRKCAERAVKAAKSRLIVPNRGETRTECGMHSSECPKAAENEQPRPNVGLAKETKGGQNAEFRIQEPEGQKGAGAVPGLAKGTEGQKAENNNEGVEHIGNEPGRETGAPSFAKASSFAPSFAEATEGRKATEDRTEDGPGAGNPGAASLPETNQRRTGDWDASNQVYWTREELERLAELRRRKQDGGNAGESDLTKATGAELGVQSPESIIQGQEADVQVSGTEGSNQPEPGPKLSARERAYIAWFEMNQGKRPVNDEELTRLYAEMEKEEEAARREALERWTAEWLKRDV